MYPIDFVRTARSLALAKLWDVTTAEAARRLYGDMLERRHIEALTSRVTKAAVGSHGTEDLPTFSRASAEFVDAVQPLTVLGRLLGYRRVPFVTPLPYISAGTEFDFVAERQQIRCTAPSFGDPVFLDRLKIAGIVATSKDLLLYAPSAEQLLFRDMSAGTISAADRRLLDPTSAAIDGERPASITHGAAGFDAAGAETPEEIDGVIGDLLGTLLAFGSTLAQVALVTTTEACTALALMRDTTGARAFPGVTVNGGELAGLPLLSSGSAPHQVLTAVDASELLVADDGDARLELSTNATVNLDDDTSGTTSVGMFQTESAAIKVIRHINWRMRNTGFVAFARNFAPPTLNYST